METKIRRNTWVLVVGILCAASILCTTASAADTLVTTCQDGQELSIINPPKVQDGTSFISYIVLSSETASELQMRLKLPNGFHLEGELPASVSLKAYEPQIIPVNISVKKFVAEQDHIIRLEMSDGEGDIVSTAETTVSVWWDWSKLEA